jgi:mannose-6-phosphate isomerase-like protein (cupin superfamily)
MTTPVPVRRVVTGHDTEGRAVVAMDGPPPVVFTHPAAPGLAFHELWNTAQVPAPIGPSDPDPTLGRPLRTPPPEGGTVIRVVDLPPEDPAAPAPGPDQVAALFALVGVEAHAAGRGGAPPRHPLMHRTESVDYGIVLSGEVTLVLDEGEVRLRAGDIVVQRGTVHAWANRSGKPCRMIFVLVDGRYAGDLAARLG